jgi:chaperonin GroES
MPKNKSVPYKMIYDRVLVKRVLEEKTKGGLILLDHDRKKEEARTGTVLARGPGKISPRGVVLPMQLEVGDQVMFGQFAGVPMEVHGEECLMMNEADILCVVG